MHGSAGVTVRLVLLCPSKIATGLKKNGERQRARPRHQPSSAFLAAGYALEILIGVTMAQK